jgi:regulatory protein YycH of two-component signal transduction system YycFG
MKIIVRNDTDKLYKFHELDFQNKIFPEGLSIEHEDIGLINDAYEINWSDYKDEFGAIKPLKEVDFHLELPKDYKDIWVKPLLNSNGKYIDLQYFEKIIIERPEWSGFINPYDTVENMRETGVKLVRIHPFPRLEFNILPFSHFELTIL